MKVSARKRRNNLLKVLILFLLVGLNESPSEQEGKYQLLHPTSVVLVASQ